MFENILYPYRLTKKNDGGTAPASLTNAEKPAASAKPSQSKKNAALTRRNELQQETGTAYDRYPRTFRHLKRLLDADKRHFGYNILSFGCSTGEEVAALADIYFADKSDRIVGVDINEPCIKKAVKSNRHPDRVEFVVGSTAETLRHGPFDAVMAMSVLCNWPQTGKVDDCSKLFPFTRFDSLLSELDAVVRIGGFIVIVNANFRFSDASISDRYALCPLPGVDNSGFVAKFDKKNKRIVGEPEYRYSIFKKLLA